MVGGSQLLRRYEKQTPMKEKTRKRPVDVKAETELHGPRGIPDPSHAADEETL